MNAAPESILGLAERWARLYEVHNALDEKPSTETTVAESVLFSTLFDEYEALANRLLLTEARTLDDAFIQVAFLTVPAGILGSCVMSDDHTERHRRIIIGALYSIAKALEAHVSDQVRDVAGNHLLDPNLNPHTRFEKSNL